MAEKWSSRRGISLMEVLISMFVLAIGLLGVAALIPAGRHEIVEATKLETAAMVGRNAFKEIQTRGYLNPELNPLNLPTTASIGWRDDYTYGNAGTFRYHPNAVRTDGVRVPFTYTNPSSPTQADFDDPTKFSQQLRVVIDPLGMTAPAGLYGNTFPFGAPTTPPPLRRIVPFQPQSNAFATFDNTFRSSVDLVTQRNATNKDLPPTQNYFSAGGTLLRRMSEGNYSWFATIVSDPSRPATSGEVDVAVAVFYKRNLGTVDESVSTTVTIPTSRLLSGGEASITLPAGRKPLKPGQWLMLAGSKSVGLGNWNYYRWYRVLSAAVPNSSNVQNVTLAGQDWDASRTTHAWLFDNIVNVYEKSMPLELN
jgi:Tfp pilus assembly protein PilV